MTPLLGLHEESDQQIETSTCIISVEQNAAVSNHSVTNAVTLRCANGAIINIRSEITTCHAVEPGKWTVSVH